MNEIKIPPKEILTIVSQDFKVNDNNYVIPAADVSTLDELKKYLAEKLAYLLEYKYDFLINTLYRIDVNEYKLQKLFSGKNREFIPSGLAELIIERQIEKLKFRKLYKNGRL